MLKKGQGPIATVMAIALAFFSIYFWSAKNYEFIIYIGVIVVFAALILSTNKKVNYPNNVLWGLVVWAIMHMSGGALYFGGTRLYEIILIPLSKTLPILRYDQFVHIVGFGVATCLMYALLKEKLKPGTATFASIGIVTVMAGLGVGALNEMIEFAATLMAPETGVGGYMNTSLDLVADFVGALLAWVWIARRGKV